MGLLKQFPTVLSCWPFSLYAPSAIHSPFNSGLEYEPALSDASDDIIREQHTIQE
jgi:hypothetical protein